MTATSGRHDDLNEEFVGYETNRAAETELFEFKVLDYQKIKNMWNCKDEIQDFNFPQGVAPFKWRGWKFDKPLPGVTHLRMSFNIKFLTPVPKRSENFGVKIQGYLINDWV